MLQLPSEHRELIALKGDVEYGTKMPTTAHATSLVRRAHVLVDVAEEMSSVESDGRLLTEPAAGSVLLTDAGTGRSAHVRRMTDEGDFRARVDRPP